MEKPLDIISIGECLLELSTTEYFENTENFNLSFGGDVILASSAAQKMGANVGLLTSIGDDSFKNLLLHKLNEQGFDISRIKVSNEKNGLYLAGHNDQKELITYRRRVAGSMLDVSEFDEEYIKSAKAIYTSGITQSLSINSNALIKKIFETAKENEILTAYDPNYTSSFMTVYDTKEFLEEIIGYIDILFLSLKNDIEHLYGLTSADKIINHFVECGIKTVVIKSHQENGYYVYYNGKTEFIPYYAPSYNVYIMGAGDVFNGGMLAGILKGLSPFEAAFNASKQTAGFIQNNGIIKNIPSFEEVMRI